MAYARIQGSTALINHFQNSNIMKAGVIKFKYFRIKGFVLIFYLDRVQMVVQNKLNEYNKCK